MADESKTAPRGRSGEGCLCIRTIDEVWLVKAAIVGRQGGSAVAWSLSALACPHVMICFCLTCWRDAAWISGNCSVQPAALLVQGADRRGVVERPRTLALGDCLVVLTLGANTRLVPQTCDARLLGR